MLDLHLALAELYYPDMHGANVTHMVYKYEVSSDVETYRLDARLRARKFAASKAWKAANPERDAAARRERRVNNPGINEAEKARKKLRYATNPEYRAKILAYNKARRKK